MFEWVDRSILGEKYTYCHFCNNNLNTISRGTRELRRHMMTNKHKRRSLNSRNQASGSLPCSDVAVWFISEYCESAPAPGEEAPTDLARRKLGSRYPGDIESACQSAPYCVYIYGGVTLKPPRADGSISVVLVGFFDAGADRHCVRFLDAFREGNETAAAVVKTLRDFKLPKENLVAAYSEGTAESSEQIFLHLRDLNPNVVALNGLYTVADAACRAGLKELSKQVQQLVEDIYAHFSSCLTKNSNLKAIFGPDVSADSQTFLLNASCLNCSSVVSKILEMWSELLLYFKSCNKNDEKAKLIFSQLQDCKVRATFMFLEQALKPLHRFQRRLQTQEESAGARLQLIAEGASNLLCTYASLFLRPQAAVRFLEEPDALENLENEKYHLLNLDLSVGDKAVGEFLNKSVGKDATLLLSKEALSFYIAVMRCITESLPLGQRVLQSIAQLLSPHSWLKVAGKAVGELGTRLGICSSAEEVGQLTDEFLQCQLPEREKKNWASLIKDEEPPSLFRKLLLTLLAFPCPPLEPKAVFTQVCTRMDPEPRVWTKIAVSFIM